MTIVVASSFSPLTVTTSTPPSSDNLLVGKHVGEDSSVTRAHEIVGFIVVEAGGVDDAPRAGVGSDTVRGHQNDAPYSYDYEVPFAPDNAPEVTIVTQAAMDGDGRRSGHAQRAAAQLLDHHGSHRRRHRR